MEAKLLFLGTGGSLGIPVITCKCPVCTSTNPLNKRTRPSALLEVGKKRFLIDVGPDFRQQALHFGVEKLTGVLLTHSHYDHIGGIDELRVFYFKEKLRMPILSSIETYQELRHRFHYLFQTKQADGSLQSQFDFQILEEDFGKATFQGLKLEYVSYTQANMKVNGYKFGPLAYISDIRHFDKRIIEDLQGTEILIVSAVRYDPSEVHFNIDEAVEFSRAVGAKQTYFTHMAHDLEHDATNQKLPRDVRLAHDGLELPFIL